MFMLKKIKDTGLTQRKINHEKVAKAMKATSAVKIDKSGSPATLFAVRRHIVASLKSTGGRPSVIENGERKKISFYKEDWDVLKNIARDYREKENIKVSPGQLAAILIHKELTAELKRENC